MNTPNQVRAGLEPHGWNVEQILVFIWHCVSGETPEEEYPYKQFRDSGSGQRLRVEMEALASRAAEAAGVPQDELRGLVEKWRAYQPFPSTAISETAHNCADELEAILSRLAAGRE